MKYENDSLKELKRKVRQEQQALRTGSPSDAEIGQAQLADLASGYIPGLVEEVLDLRAALETATARATKAESRADGLQAELAEQEKEKLMLIRQLPPEGDGGLWALQSLEDYFREGGHRAALANIRAAAHNMGWCLDDMGVDQIVPTTGICPLCDYNSAPHPAPAPPPSSPAAAGAGEEWYPGEAEKELKGMSARLSRAEKVLEENGTILGRYEVSGLPVYDDDDYVVDAEGCYLNRAEATELIAEHYAAAATTTGEGKEADRG